MGHAVTVTTQTASPTTPRSAAVNAPPPAAVAPAAPPAPPGSATERVRRYFVALGLNPDAAATLTDQLEQRMDPQLEDPTARATDMLEAFDRWIDELPAALGRPTDAARIKLLFSLFGPALLGEHPEALRQPDQLAGPLDDLLDAWPHGLLPNLPHQTMTRQPLGELPSVMRGDFWTSTYRWALPDPKDPGLTHPAPAADGPPLETDPRP
jgi:hypothetical protein